LALSLHAGAAVGAVQAAIASAFAQWAVDIRGSVEGLLAQTYDVDVMRPAEPEVAQPPEPKAEPSPPPPTADQPPAQAESEPTPAPPAAADAVKVLTSEPASEEPVDLTGNTFVSGNAAVAVGGVTQVGGTAKAPTYNPNASATGVGSGTGSTPAPAPARIDRSRAAQIVNKANLERCPFPPEADAEQVDEAAVGIEVRVGVSGRAESVSITRDPGHGFGREARKCALRETYAPALNQDGLPIPGIYRVNFRFSR